MVTDEIYKAIEAGLPQLTGQALKKRLEQAEADAEGLVRLNKVVATQANHIKELESKLKDAQDTSYRIARLEQGEEELALEQIQLKADRRVVDLISKHASERVADHQKMVELIFRSPVKKTTTSTPLVVPGGTTFTGTYDNEGNPVFQELAGVVQVETSVTQEEQV